MFRVYASFYGEELSAGRPSIRNPKTHHALGKEHTVYRMSTMKTRGSSTGSEHFSLLQTM
jgi:hypothetical protein